MQEALDRTSRALRKHKGRKLYGTAVIGGRGERDQACTESSLCGSKFFFFLWLWSSATLRMVFTGKLGEFPFCKGLLSFII